MTKSSKHKSHKHSKHSSKEYAETEDDVKMKTKSSKDENLKKVHSESVSGEKRKISSVVGEGKDSKDHSGKGNGDVSKRRKEKADIADVVGGGDRWNGGGEDKRGSDRNVEKGVNQKGSLKIDSTLKEVSDKGESFRTESKNKSKRHGSGSAVEKKEDDLASVVVDKEEGKSKGESKRKLERDSTGQNEAKESKDKDRRSAKEKNGDPESKLVDVDVGKKQASRSNDVGKEKQGKRAQDNTERAADEESQNLGLEKENEKKMRKKMEGSSGKDKLCEASKEGDERLVSLRVDHRAKDSKSRDHKQKDGSFADKYQEDGNKDDMRRDAKYREEADKDNKYSGEKYQEYGVKETRNKDDRYLEDDVKEARCKDDRYLQDDMKEARRKDDRYLEDDNRNNRRKDEKHREDGEQERRQKDERYAEGAEREHRDDKYYEDGNKDNRRKSNRHREDGDKDIRRGDEKYYEDGDRDDRRKESSYRKDFDRDNRTKDKKYREDFDQDTRLNDRMPGDDFDRDNRLRNPKNRDDPSDSKRSRDDGFAADYHSRKSSACGESPTYDDRSARYQEDHGRRSTNEKESYSDLRSRNTMGQRNTHEKRSANSPRMDPVSDMGRSTSRNAEFNSSHNRRRSSPTISSHAARDHYRVPKPDESKYRDYSYEVRSRHNITFSRDNVGAVGGFQLTSSSRSLEKQKADSHSGDLAAERHLESDIRLSSLQLVDNPSPSTDRRQFSRPDITRNADTEKSIHGSGGSRDVKEYSSKDDEFPQADADTSSYSSPFKRNSHFGNSSKSIPPPPPFRTGVDSPKSLGLAEDDSRGKLNNRNRRIGDPNMGRIQGNAWRGVPGWPSPVANGFLPFPHAPPPVGFHPVMQPFPVPSMFGVGSSMDLNYRMPNPDRFSGPGHPMVWRNQVDGSGPPFNSWDVSNGSFGDDYGRPDWDRSGGRGWEKSGDLWKGPNRNASFEMASTEKGDNSTRSPDEDLAGKIVQPTEADQQADSAEISQSIKSIGKDDVKAPIVTLEETNDIAKMPRKDDVHHSYVYLSKLDISADLAEPELLMKCIGLLNVDQSTSSDLDDSKILFMEEAVEAKVGSPHKILSYSLFPSGAESVFQKAMSLYKRTNVNIKDSAEEKLQVSSKLLPNSDQTDQNVEEDDTEKLYPVDDMQVDSEVKEEPPNNLLTVEVCADASKQIIGITEQIGEPIFALDNVNPLVGFQEHDDDDVKKEPPPIAEIIEVTDTYLAFDVKDMESDAKCDPLINSDDMSSEVVERIMSESVVSESVNLSRIHHSPESTH